LNKYAWEIGFLADMHPVGLKKPVFFNGKPVYDIHGNVFKWLQDSWDGSSYEDLPFGVDPVWTNASGPRIYRGAWSSDKGGLRSGYRPRNAFLADRKQRSLSFRLASDVP
jgi:formylglycine-generating enzyme required for sulfatase activity